MSSGPYQLPIYRVSLVREGTLTTATATITSPEDAATILREHLDGADREMLVVLLLDVRNGVRGIHTASVGTLTESLVHPREIFKAAIAGNAAAILLGHNHPSGDPEPSPEDLVTTRRLVEAGKTVGISVLDHVILGETGYVSLRERKQL
ncbi:MAG: JAB domain-containing protein [Armatimonadota bacterium]